jgi:hypothetical protein
MPNPFSTIRMRSNYKQNQKPLIHHIGHDKCLYWDADLQNRKKIFPYHKHIMLPERHQITTDYNIYDPSVYQYIIYGQYQNHTFKYHSMLSDMYDDGKDHTNDSIYNTIQFMNYNRYKDIDQRISGFKEHGHEIAIYVDTYDPNQDNPDILLVPSDYYNHLIY